MRNGSVTLQPHNPKWDEAFTFESNRLASQLKNEAIEIHHVGSTSIATICAKPILDLLLVAPSLNEIDQGKSVFEGLGYEYKGEYGIPGRRYSVLYNEEKTMGYVHIHAFPANHLEVHRHLLFRDYLRAFPEVARQYEELKISLLETNIKRSNYTEAKAPFIERALIDAENWHRPK